MKINILRTSGLETLPSQSYRSTLLQPHTFPSTAPSKKIDFAFFRAGHMAGHTSSADAAAGGAVEPPDGPSADGTLLRVRPELVLQPVAEQLAPSVVGGSHPTAVTDHHGLLHTWRVVTVSGSDVPWNCTVEDAVSAAATALHIPRSHPSHGALADAHHSAAHYLVLPRCAL